MRIRIGENIKRLRREKGITQEQLADILNVSCAAISKWENGDSYPDITLIFPLSHYFKVSVDELMGYDETVIENEIASILDEYRSLYNSLEYEKANALIKEARKKYPNDYNIMIRYLFVISGGLADNDPKVLTKNAEEINTICDTILNGCNDEKIRLEALTMKAKVLHAQGDTNKALEVLTDFPSFYHASGQRIEQLYAKDTKEFFRQLNLNMYELMDFAANKLAKSIFYDQSLTNEEKKEKAIKIGEGLKHFYNDQDFAVFILLARMFWGEVKGKAMLLHFDQDFIIKCYEEVYEATYQLDILLKDNKILKAYLQENVIDTKGSYLLNYIEYQEKHILSLDLLNNEKYKKIVNKYK